MWMFWNLHSPVWSPEDGAGGGGEDGNGGEAEGSEGAENGGEKPGSILDTAGDGEEGGEGGEWTPPADLPEHLRGADVNETLTKVMDAYKGARDKIAKGTGGLEGEVPDSADGYKIEATGDDDVVAAELNKDESKPVLDAFRNAALKVGMPDKAFEAFIREGLTSLAEDGIPIGVSDDQAIELSGQQEREQLIKIVGDPREAGTVISTVDAFGKNMVEAGVMSEADLDEFRVMVGTAESAHIMYRILTAKLGEKPIPPSVGGEGEMSAADAYANYSKALSMSPGPERDQAIEDAMAAMKRAYGDKSAGSIRSKVV